MKGILILSLIVLLPLIQGIAGDSLFTKIDCEAFYDEVEARINQGFQMRFENEDQVDKFNRISQICKRETKNCRERAIQTILDLIKVKVLDKQPIDIRVIQEQLKKEKESCSEGFKFIKNENSPKEKVKQNTCGLYLRNIMDITLEAEEGAILTTPEEFLVCNNAYVEEENLLYFYQYLQMIAKEFRHDVQLFTNIVLDHSRGKQSVQVQTQSCEDYLRQIYQKAKSSNNGVVLTNYQSFEKCEDEDIYDDVLARFFDYLSAISPQFIHNKGIFRQFMEGNNIDKTQGSNNCQNRIKDLSVKLQYVINIPEIFEKELKSENCDCYLQKVEALILENREKKMNLSDLVLKQSMEICNSDFQAFRGQQLSENSCKTVFSLFETQFGNKITSLLPKLSNSDKQLVKICSQLQDQHSCKQQALIEVFQDLDELLQGKPIDLNLAQAQYEMELTKCTKKHQIEQNEQSVANRYFNEKEVLGCSWYSKLTLINGDLYCGTIYKSICTEYRYYYQC